MKKAEFMEILRYELRLLPQQELHKQLTYYEEMLNDMTEDGMTEEEATARLGDPREIARQILREIPVGTPPMQPPKKTSIGKASVWMIAAAVLGAPIWIPLLAAMLTLVLGVVIAVIAVIVALFAVVLGLVVGGFALIASAFLSFGGSLSMGLLVFGVGMLCIGLGVLFALAAVGLWRGVRYLMGKLRAWMSEQASKKEGRI